MDLASNKSTNKRTTPKFRHCVL